jgi:hypothetical protein
MCDEPCEKEAYVTSSQQPFYKLGKLFKYSLIILHIIYSTLQKFHPRPSKQKRKFNPPYACLLAFMTYPAL